MSSDNQFFRPVGEVCQSNVITCTASDPLVTVAEIMRDRNISSVVVCEGEKPIGIVTDRDLRNKVLAGGKAPDALTVGQVMNSPLSVIADSAHLYEAMYQMSRLRIHRLGAVDAQGQLSGIITDSDILRQQAHSPHQLVLNIEKAEDLDELANQYVNIRKLAVHLSGSGMQTRDAVQLIAHLNDQVLKRLIAYLREFRFPDLDDNFAFVVLGSEGRGEQTLSTDQDNAIVHADGLSTEQIEAIEAFSIELIDSLIGLGVPPCPGGIMAKNAPWRRSVGEWTAQLERWLGSPSPENVLSSSMFADIRTICGDPAFEHGLRQRMIELAASNRSFLMHMAKNLTRFAPPLGWFGRIKVETGGAMRGKFDIKKAGIFAITEGVKILAWENACMQGGTHDRIAALVDRSVLNRSQADDLVASFEYLLRMRLRGQVEAIKTGSEPTNYVALDHMNRMERGRTRIALQEVKTFQKFIAGHFRLDQMA